MIKEYEFFHGTVFARIFHSMSEPVSIKRYPTLDNAAYVLNENVGIYIKYSAKRLPPWQFSFQKRHQDEMLEMKETLGEVFLLLVCNDDGIVTLSYEEVKAILNEVHEEAEWISARRGKRQMYAVAGSDGRLGFKVGKDDFRAKLVAKLKSHPETLDPPVTAG